MRKILLLLALLAFASEAFGQNQGAAHQNIALTTVALPPNLGIPNPVLQPIPSAIITVCLGSTLPPSGQICNPTTPIYSDAGLTVSIPNPTNADLKGNYTFFAPPAQPYVVSVSGAGVVTYSYIWSAPNVSTFGNGSAFFFNQLIANNVWTINHNFNSQVAVFCSVGGAWVVPDNVNTTNPNQAVVSFVNNEKGNCIVWNASPVQGVQKVRTAGCPTPAILNSTCQVIVNWTTPFADTSYTATCSGEGVTSGFPLLQGIAIAAPKAASNITVQTIALSGVSAQFTTIDCIAVHD